MLNGDPCFWLFGIVSALQSAKFPTVLVLVAQIYLLFNDIPWHVSPQRYLTSVPSFSFL